MKKVNNIIKHHISTSASIGVCFCFIVSMLLTAPFQTASAQIFLPDENKEQKLKDAQRLIHKDRTVDSDLDVETGALEGRVRIEKNRIINMNVFGSATKGTTNRSSFSRIKGNETPEVTLYNTDAETQKKFEKIASSIEQLGYAYSGEGFVNAALASDIETIDLFLQSSVSIDARNSLNDTALLAAVKSNNLEIVAKLIANNANINIKDSKGLTPLIHATDRQLGGMFNLLIDARADITIIDNEEKTALFYAIAKKNVPMANILIALGSEINKANRYGTTPLMLSAWKDVPDVTDKLLQKKAKITTRDFNGNTALILATIYGNFDVARILLKNGADANEQNRRGTAIIDLAIDYGHMDIANLLLAYGANRPKILGN